MALTASLRWTLRMSLSWFPSLLCLLHSFSLLVSSGCIFLINLFNMNISLWSACRKLVGWNNCSIARTETTSHSHLATPSWSWGRRDIEDTARVWLPNWCMRVALNVPTLGLNTVHSCNFHSCHFLSDFSRYIICFSFLLAWNSLMSHLLFLFSSRSQCKWY